MAGEKTIKRLREHADAAGGMDVAVMSNAADKIERLVAALGSAKVAIANRHDKKFLDSAERDINEALRELDADL